MNNGVRKTVLNTIIRLRREAGMLTIMYSKGKQQERPKKKSDSRFLNFWAIFESPFTPQTRLRIPPNFAKTRFGRFPTFHFSTSKKCFETSNGRLPTEDGSVRPQTLGKRVSDDARHFIFRC